MMNLSFSLLQEDRLSRISILLCSPRDVLTNNTVVYFLIYDMTEYIVHMFISSHESMNECIMKHVFSQIS